MINNMLFVLELQNADHDVSGEANHPLKYRIILNVKVDLNIQFKTLI